MVNEIEKLLGEMEEDAKEVRGDRSQVGAWADRVVRDHLRTIAALRAALKPKCPDYYACGIASCCEEQVLAALKGGK